MKRYLRYLLLAFVAVACVNENELSEPFLDQDGEAILVPRVKSFTNQYVTKAGYAQDEAKITSLAVLVFNSKGEFVHHEEASSGNLSSMTLNKTYLAKLGDMKGATLVMFANVSLDAIKKGGTTLRTAMTGSGQPLLTLQGLQDYAYHHDAGKTVITDLGNGFAGFPMTGRVDGIDLSATLESQAPIEIGLRILYAKVNFSISVAPGSENEGTGMQFVLDGYSVHNISKVTSYKELQGSEATVSTDYAYHQEGYSVAQTGTTTLRAGNPLTFTFYLAESRFAHGLTNFNGIYPAEWLTSAQDDDVKNYTQLSPEEQAKPENWLNGVKYHYDGYVQQYKPLVANASADAKPGQGLATYVLVKGAYTDYRGTVWDVNYKVYLGKDNGQNFQVDRNSEYKNYLTIKGIRNNDSDDGRGEVWFDHRVDVSCDGLSSHVAITRQTLIDSHIEVRPLHVRWVDDPNDEKDGYRGVRVYLPQNSDGTLVNWIGMERFAEVNCQESTIYCYDKNRKSTGKRRYFTTSLISELQSKEGEYGVQVDEAQKYITLLNGECAWIYFDENVVLPAKPREAQIVLEFYPIDENKPVETITYQVIQKGLQQSVGGYAYESYEEYLHSYDSYDTYNLSTSPVDYTQQGLKWGYKGVSLSSDIIVSKNTLVLADISQGLYGNRYDFLVEGDSYDAWHMYRSGGILWDEIDYTEHSGKYFTDRVTEKKKVSVKDMGSMPESAYQYCLSKNKFTADDDGNVTMKIHWYLPDVHEMQDIFSSPSHTLSSDVYYWSSQPSFDEVPGLTSTFLNENQDLARVVSNFVEMPVDLPREQQHRIRCLYSPNGIPANMEGRTPDGIGGNHTFVMKAYLDKNKSGTGYFNYLITPLSPETKTTTEQPYNDNSYDYPKKSNSYPTKVEFEYEVTTDKAGNNFEGFVVDPDEKSNWDDVRLPIINTFLGYRTLARYDGLSANVVKTLSEGSDLLELIDRYLPNLDLTSVANETTIPKSDTLIEVNASTLQYQRDLVSNPDLNLLLPQEEGGVSIRFSQQDGNQHPTYNFLEYQDGGTRTTSVRNWITPRYEPETREMEGGETLKFEFEGRGEDDGTSYEYILRETMDDAKKRAFEGVILVSDGAYTKAKKNAELNLEDELKKDEYKGWSRGAIIYTPLTYTSTDIYVTINGKRVKAVQYTERTDTETHGWLRPQEYDVYHATCVVNLIATIQLTKPGFKTLYVQAPGTGKWGEGIPDGGVPVSSVVETDQLKVFSGNSFTISVSNPDYEITRIKVHYSENNYIVDFATGDKAFARFIDSTIPLPTATEPSGMDYQEDETGGIHQWSGAGRSQVTLVLADYLDMTDVGNWFQKTLRYEKATKDLSKYLIIDKIEVKCTKKPEAQP